jgi:hypothetical protein
LLTVFEALRDDGINNTMRSARIYTLLPMLLESSNKRERGNIQQAGDIKNAHRVSGVEPAVLQIIQDRGTARRTQDRNPSSFEQAHTQFPKVLINLHVTYIHAT